MKPAVAYLGTIAVGVVTCIATAVAALLIQRWTGVTVHGFSVWVIIPLGALITGTVAVSGFSLGARWFRCPPRKSFRLVIVACAAATWVGIYFAEYQTLRLDDDTWLRDVISFTAFLKLLFTQAKHDIMSSHGSAHDIQFGAFGYVVAVIQFLGFIAGGFLLGDPPTTPEDVPAPATPETTSA